ncbi:MAG: hypothetical protein AB4060_16710, partial [Crocosphaera sp.]
MNAKVATGLATNGNIDQGYHQCGICDHRTEIDPSQVVEDDRPEPINDYYGSIRYQGYDGDNFPSTDDMDVFSYD